CAPPHCSQAWRRSPSGGPGRHARRCAATSSRGPARDRRSALVAGRARAAAGTDRRTAVLLRPHGRGERARARHLRAHGETGLAPRKGFLVSPPRGPILSADDWAQLQPILAAALDLPTGERGAFLDSACGSDVRLRAQAERLLSPSTPTADFLERPAFRPRDIRPPEAQ